MRALIGGARSVIYCERGWCAWRTKVAGWNLQESGGSSRPHYSDVYAYCRRHTESVDEAEDAVQEVFLRFVGASGRYRDDGRPLAYLLTIARNVCADSHRRGAMRADELPCDEVLADPSPGSGSADRLSAVRRAVRALPNEAREIVELKFDQGLTAVEIARVTGLSRFAVARRIGSALSDIREALASEEGDA